MVDIEEEKKKTLEMLTRRIFGIASGSIVDAENDIYLWQCFIQQIKRDLDD